MHTLTAINEQSKELEELNTQVKECSEAKSKNEVRAAELAQELETTIKRIE